MNKPIIISGKYTNLQTKIIKEAFKYLKDIPAANRYRHISIIASKGDIIEAGTNNEGASVDGRAFGYLSLHSEYNVVKKFLRSHYAGQLQYYDLWSVRIDRYNRIVNSRPCQRCRYLLSIFRPRRIYYSNENGAFEQWQN